MLIDVEHFQMMINRLGMIEHYVGPVTLCNSGNAEVKLYLTGTNNFKTIEDAIK